LLKPGAPLVYAVCSLEPEEGPGIVAAALKRRLAARAAHDEVPAEFITADGDMRTHPGIGPRSAASTAFTPRVCCAAKR
jgi:16S rRNA (cytosine967-C5)-methyltransferase